MLTQRALFDAMKSQKKYGQILTYYNKHMPTCIKACKGEMKKKLSDPADSIVGPQGIYWIGSKAKIMVVGIENHGWNDFSKYSRESIQYEPLWFFYHRSAFMSGFWNRMYFSIMKPVLLKTVFKGSGQDDLDWNDIIPYLAVTNLCKCYNPKIQYELSEKCYTRGFMTKEIEASRAQIVVLFTGSSYDVIDQMTAPIMSRPIAGGLIWKAVMRDRVYYQLNHPSRESAVTIEALTADIVKVWRKRKL